MTDATTATTVTCPYCGHVHQVKDADWRYDLMACDACYQTFAIRRRVVHVVDALPLWGEAKPAPQPAPQPEPNPDWSAAPEWAQWWAVDWNEYAYWYPDKPVRKMIEWDTLSTQWAAFAGRVPLNGTDWRTTLRKRPEVA